ncbi:Protein MODIFIER OF SNC1 11 [Ananas comosus]|uniref:Protein MODIFIER OF SNC1 11 n=1 Tax=Ananas comosus TaxID=4615 RepID=A0A199VBZ8_ANACO|nr:Protein MODIFIER OF SNC1 11 [Ananas comosus]
MELVKVKRLEEQDLGVDASVTKQPREDPLSKTLDPSPTLEAAAKPYSVALRSGLAPATTASAGGAGDPGREGRRERVTTAAAVLTAAAATATAAAGEESDLQKKIRRAERFGMPVMLSEEEKRNTRAESSIRTGGTGPLEEQKRKARAERLYVEGCKWIGYGSDADEEAKKKARIERFGQSTKHGMMDCRLTATDISLSVVICTHEGSC